ncbi:MAG: LPS assembly protein LptD, partial [Gammaproteobacteria bacterium]
MDEIWGQPLHPPSIFCVNRNEPRDGDAARADCPSRPFRASLPILTISRLLPVPTSHRFAAPRPQLPLRLLPALLMLALADSVSAQSETGVITLAPSPVCPVGVVRCPKPVDQFARCKRNDLLDFFTPGLPPAGDRSKAQTTADADKVTRTDTTHDLLEGDVRMQRLDALLRADVVTYNSATTDYVANGHVRYQDAGMPMSADHAHGTTTPQSTYLDNVRYQMLDKRGNGVAATANETDPDHSAMTLGTFSTCDPSERQWELRANDMQIDKIKNEGRGHGVTMAYQGVPFFWFPYLAWPLDSERQSGFLAPSIGYSDKRGLKVGIPYYFDLAPNYDATLKATEFTKRGPMLGGEFRYLSNWDKLQFDFSWLPHDDESTHSNRGFVRLQDTATFSPNWGANVDIHHVSDNQYLHDFGDNFLTTAVSLLQSTASVNGHGDWWRTSIGGDTWQVTDPSLEPFCATPGVPLSKCTAPFVFKPYTRLPRLTFNAFEKVGGLELGLDSEFVNFHR